MPPVWVMELGEGHQKIACTFHALSVANVAAFSQVAITLDVMVAGLGRKGATSARRLILRDGADSGDPQPVLYGLQDANSNVTGIVHTSGDVAERYVYDPYGAVTPLTPDWLPLSGTQFGWNNYHQGLRFVIDVGFYYNRRREYSPSLMRFVQGDPIELRSNLYAYVGNSPGNWRDSYGLQASRVEIHPATLGDALKTIERYRPQDLESAVRSIERSYGVKQEDKQAWNALLKQHSLVRVHRPAANILSNFAAFVQFSCKCPASVMQTVQFTQTTRSLLVGVDDTVEHMRLVEGWVPDKNGKKILAVDTHGTRGPRELLSRSMRIDFELEIGCGLYDEDGPGGNAKPEPVTGEKTKGGIKGVYDVWPGADPANVKWLGPTRRYRIMFEIDSEGNWGFGDEAAGVLRAGKFEKEQPPR